MDQNILIFPRILQLFSTKRQSEIEVQKIQENAASTMSVPGE
jgi:hypothetical protein